MEGVVGALFVELFELDGCRLLVFAGCGRFFRDQLVDRFGLFNGHGPFGDRNDAEAFAPSGPVVDRVGHGFDAVGDFGG